MEYSLPFRSVKAAKREKAPFHKLAPNLKHCVDFRLPEGTPVLAVADGVVVGRESRYGKNFSEPALGLACANFVIIRHSDGKGSIYVHLAWRSVKVKVGQRVKRGQVIALSGQTGYATYPHLHFGLYDSHSNNIPVRFSH